MKAVVDVTFSDKPAVRKEFEVSDKLKGERLLNHIDKKVEELMAHAGDPGPDGKNGPVEWAGWQLVSLDD